MVISYLGMTIVIIAALIWNATFAYIPIEAYIVILFIYSVVSWIWIMKQKKWNVIYFLVWIVLGVLSVFLYWRGCNFYFAALHY